MKKAFDNYSVEAFVPNACFIESPMPDLEIEANGSNVRCRYRTRSAALHKCAEDSAHCSRRARMKRSTAIRLARSEPTTSRVALSSRFLIRDDKTFVHSR